MTKPIGTYDYKLKKRFAKRLDKAYQYALNKHLAIRMIRDAINENELTSIFLDENITGILKRKKVILFLRKKQNKLEAQYETDKKTVGNDTGFIY